LGLTRFFRDMLTLKGEENRESAVAEFHRLLAGISDWDDRAADDVLRQVLTALLNDVQALTRIYASQQARARLASMLTSITTDAAQFRMALEIFLPVH